MDEDSLKVLLARGLSVEQIGRRFGRDPSTVSYWLKKHGLEAPNRAKYAAKGGIGRERLEELVGEGRSIAEIAEAVELSKGTVRHWLRKYGMKTHGSSRVREASSARTDGLLVIRRECATHGMTEFVIEGRGYYRCKRCRAERVITHRRAVKAQLVDEAGGRCAVCGYERYLGALEFHHLDPSDKRLGLSQGGNALSMATLRAEAAKCVLLCSNCHAEVEGGVVGLALKSDRRRDEDVAEG